MSETNTSLEEMNSVSDVVQQVGNTSDSHILEDISDKTEDGLHNVSQDNNNTGGLLRVSHGNTEELHQVLQDNELKESPHPVFQDNEESPYPVLQDINESLHQVSQDNEESPHPVLKDNEESPHPISQDNEESLHQVSQDNDGGLHKVLLCNSEVHYKVSLDNGDTGNILNAEIEIKQEIVDFDYERMTIKYRGKPIVVYSDSDSESSTDSFVIPRALDNENCDEEGDEQQIITHPHQSASLAVKKFVSRTEGEVFPEELPPMEYLTISPDEDVALEPLGIVSGIVDVLVVVKAFTDSPALYDDTVLFLEGRRPLGLIFETFGTVHQPFYSVRFNCNKDIKEQNIELGNKVFFAPKASNLTKYVFISELRKIKFDDASWEHDNEPPPTHIEFSDDEEEKLAKQRQRNQFRRADAANGMIAVRKKRRRNFPTDNGHAESNGPQLLQGDLNRNPFGNGGHNYKGHGSKPWPPKANNLSSNNQWPPREPSAGPQPHPTTQNRKSQSTYFGGKPNWQMQTTSFVNYSSTPGFNLNIPPPSFTNPGGSNFNSGPNNQYLSQFNHSQPTSQFNHSQPTSQFNHSQPPHFNSILNPGSLQPNAAQYPANRPLQNFPSQYPANTGSSLQNPPYQYHANR